MGKNKLERFAEMKSFENVFQPSNEEALSGNYYLKAGWNEKVFNNNNKLVLELGCGKGEYSVALAKTFPEINCIGVDIKGARIWRGAKTALESHLKNVVFLRTRIEMIQSFFSPDEVDEIWITFPDPQLKKRRKKKRLTSAGFLKRYQHFLKNEGLVHLKTDNDVLYNYTLNVIAYNKLELTYKTNNVHLTDSEDKLLQVKTHYEQLFLKEGKNINYLKFKLPNGIELLEPPEDG